MTYKPMFPDSRSMDEIRAPVSEEKKKFFRQIIEEEQELLRMLKESGD